MNEFAVMSLEYKHHATLIYIRARTNSPCHLTCYWTIQKPVRHKTSRVLRGLDVPWGAYFCFVAWLTTPQIEAGDTYYHTFLITGWTKCQTRYFTFLGTVAGTQSPSISAIFTHHHPGELLTALTLRPSAPGDECNIDREDGAPCPDHYLNVDDVIPDEHTTRTFTKSLTWLRDLYNIQSSPITSGIINKITIYVRIYAPFVILVTAAFKICLKTRGTVFESPPFAPFPGVWNTFSMEWLNNPAGGFWTWEDIADLQIGISLRSCNLPRQVYTFITQEYVIIDC